VYRKEGKIVIFWVLQVHQWGAYWRKSWSRVCELDVRRYVKFEWGIPQKRGLGWCSGYGTALLVGRSRDRFPVVLLGIFSVVSLTEPCALGSTQPLKVNTRDFSWGKGGQCIWLMTYHPCSAETSRKSGALTYPEPLGPPRPVAGDLYFFIP